MKAGPFCFTPHPCETGRGLMPFEAEIAEVGRLLSRMPHAEIGRGPRHPKRPQKALADRVVNHLRDLQLDQIDRHYAAFLLGFAGASVEYSDNSIYVDIFGFSEGVCTDLSLPEGDFVDEAGFYMFCSSVFQTGPTQFLEDITGVAFAFDTS